jgi:hypothetical protein
VRQLYNTFPVAVGHRDQPVRTPAGLRVLFTVFCVRYFVSLLP